MKVLIKSEHNFFLFQDIVYYYLSILRGGWGFPINNKYEYNTSSYYIYESWKDLMLYKLYSFERTKLYKKMINKLTEWMVTTNIAILTAQKERKCINRYDEEYLRKYKPYFLIEHSNDYENYIVHLDGDIKEVFLNAVSFYKSFSDFSYNNFLQELKKYFEIDENEISKELNAVTNNYVTSNQIDNELETYEVVED